jgi:hypothetical protein
MAYSPYLIMVVQHREEYLYQYFHSLFWVVLLLVEQLVVWEGRQSLIHPHLTHLTHHPHLTRKDWQSGLNSYKESPLN